ncbi:glycerophosphodiester phosphodiesterase family protein [Streptomyces sp. NPDC057702]|uniref:glycerophosphodiester phosphodiesterase family protein n=1 Tax=unclassified Streptomyces TaxID=2593676 RepID=UPI0036AFF742
MRRRTSALVAVAVLAGAVPALTASGSATARPSDTGHGHDRGRTKPLVIAHRAGTADAPENTLVAIRTSLRAGVDGQWLSVQATRDGVPVLYRPTDLSSLTDGSGAVADRRLRDLAALNAGYQFKDAGGAYPYRAHPVRIPTLGAALDAIPANKEVYLDLKQAPAPHVVEAVSRLLDQKRAWGRVRLYSTDAQVTDLLAKNPRARVAESRDATRQRLAEVALERACKSTPPAGSWAGFELKRQMNLQEKFTLGTGDSAVTAQLWTRESVDCFRSGHKARTPIVMLGINTPQDLRTATRLGANAVLVDSPQQMIRPPRGH